MSLLSTLLDFYYHCFLITFFPLSTSYVILLHVCRYLFVFLLSHSISVCLTALRVNRHMVESGLGVLCAANTWNTCIVNEPNQILMRQQHFP